MLKLHAVELSKAYRGRKVVDDIDLEIRQGEVVGLLGPNGAGKTTTFYILVGLARPDSGRVLLDGDDITDLPMYLRARSGLSYLPQEPSVFRQLTVEENLQAVLETLPLTPEQQRDRLEELLAKMGLEMVRYNRAYTLSGGERRRLEIARSLVLEPAFILLDEPFSGIDPLTVVDIQRIIAELSGSGIGVLVTDHNVRETLKVTNRAYIINNGKIFRTGTPEALSSDPETEAANPFDEFDIASFFNQYLDSGNGIEHREYEQIERPSFDKFLSSPQGLSEHLTWQLSVTICSDTVREIAESIIGNLDEDGYLTASLEELAQNGRYTTDDLEDAVAVVQEFDPLGVAARDLRECLLIQLRTLDPQNSVAQQIVSDHLKQLQTNQLKEIARALNRPVELVKRAVDVIKKLDPRPGLRFNKTETRLVEPDVYFRKVDNEWQVFMNEDDLPQLRLSPVYRRLLARDAADREVRNYVKERFTAAMQLLKNIEKRKHTIPPVCQVNIRRQVDFLDFCPDQLKPMMIKEVAEEVGVHPSTVSRAVASKYAHTPQGVLEF